MPGATAQIPSRAAYTTEPVYRLSVDQYHDLISQGTLTADDPVELLEGILVVKMSKNEPHIPSVRRCRRAIQAILSASYFYDSDQPVTLADGEPEPDGVVVRGTIEDFDSAKVRPTDVRLVVEVSDSTLDRDRGIKLRGYARAGIVCYWIVNLVDRQIEVYTDPDSVAEVPQYRGVQIFHPGDAVSLTLDDRVVGRVEVSDVLAGFSHVHADP